MTDFRKLCQELFDELQYQTNWSTLIRAEDLQERADAALAEPDKGVPTDEEIIELMPQQMRDDFAAAARVMSSFHPDIDKTDSVFRMILNRHSVDHARAVLARWGK